MDSNNSTKDSNMEKEHSEVQDDTSVLPDEVLGIILSKLSWKDINKVKFVSRKFYGIIHKEYHKLERRKVKELSIRYNGDCRRYPFFIKIGVMAMENGDSGVFKNGSYTWIDRFENSKELSSFLKTADLRNLNKLNVPIAGDIDIFSILNKSFQEGTNINTLNIAKLLEKHLNSFQTFIRKLSSVKEIDVKRICVHSAGAKDVCPVLSSLSSLKGIERLLINECLRTNILSADMVIELFRRRPNINCLFIGTGNIEFVRNLFKEFFRMEQQRKMEDECGYDEITLRIDFYGEYEILLDILRSSLVEIGNVEEKSSSPEDVLFKSEVDCKYCFEDKHSISRYFSVVDYEFSALTSYWN